MKTFLPGIDVLLSQRRHWLSGKRVGLVSHTAAVDSQGCLSADRLHRETRLTCLMGPEHGFFGLAGAGELCQDTRHPSWGTPIYSLYGHTRKPTAAMLKNVDTIVFDIQDIGARPYTFVATLRYVLEAAAEMHREVIVADRPIPLPLITDGPMLDEKFSSFVAMVPTPMSYGMTPGETALWLKDTLGLALNLRVATMQGYSRQAGREADWPPYIPPSPAIITWEAATAFPATVFCEALTAVDCGRKTCLPFQVLGAKWLNAPATAEFLTQLSLPGVEFITHTYNRRPKEKRPDILNGVWMLVTDRNRFKPLLTAVSTIHGLQKLHGKDKVWNRKITRTGWFDKLFGTDTVRLALLDGEDGRTIAARWQKDLVAFNRSRSKVLLYKPT